MPAQRKKASSLIPILILIAAVALWAFDAFKQVDIAKPAEKRASPHRETKRTPSATKPARTGDYETYTGCTLAEEKGNDGDSFRVQLPDGRKEIFRLYFVDCPESAFKSYSGGQNNHARIDDQAADMGGITPQQAVEIGKKAKDFTLSHLGKAPFTIHTVWDSPFKDARYHAFIELNYNGKKRLLHELLVEKGYARIHTKGAKLPDGTPEHTHEKHLLDLQRTAKSSAVGAWGL